MAPRSAPDRPVRPPGELRVLNTNPRPEEPLGPEPLPAGPSARETENLQVHLAESSQNASEDGAMLKAALHQSDSTDEMRLLALATSLGPLSGDRGQLRQALEAALRVPNAAVQAEAKRRLDELNASEQLDAATE